MRYLLALLPNDWILKIATFGSVGYWKKMPGTYGSFIGLLWYTLFFHELSPFFYLIFCLLSFYFACEICTRAEVILQKKDPSCVILDEIVAMPFCFLGLQPFMQYLPVWRYMLGGFLLFRFFDIVKPWGIKKLQMLSGGVGVVMDDIAAALMSCVCLHVVTFWFLK